MSVDIKVNWNNKSPRTAQRSRIWTRSLVPQYQPNNTRHLPSQRTQQCSSQSDSAKPEWSGSTNVKDCFNVKLCEALIANDEKWKKREQANIEYVQKRGASMLAGLHLEIEKLQNLNRELERRLILESEQTKSELGKVKEELDIERKRCVELRRQLSISMKRSTHLTQALEKNAHIYKDQLNYHETKTQKLNEDMKNLTARNSTLSNQLRLMKIRNVHNVKCRQSFLADTLTPKSTSLSPQRMPCTTKCERIIPFSARSLSDKPSAISSIVKK